MNTQIKPEVLLNNLKIALEATVARCVAAGGEYVSVWQDTFFNPAYEVLTNKKDTVSRRLYHATAALQIWGGMGPWNDVGFNDDDMLYTAYLAAYNYVWKIDQE